jgi:hypothetical protein
MHPVEVGSWDKPDSAGLAAITLSQSRLILEQASLYYGLGTSAVRASRNLLGGGLVIAASGVNGSVDVPTCDSILHIELALTGPPAAVPIDIVPALMATQSSMLARPPCRH